MEASGGAVVGQSVSMGVAANISGPVVGCRPGPYGAAAELGSSEWALVVKKGSVNHSLIIEPSVPCSSLGFV